jgi:hypothetical protein
VLGVNAFRLSVVKNHPRSCGFCPAPECCQAERLETLTHAFLECPAALLVVDWALALWAALTPGTPQPPRPALTQILLGDNRAAGWAPQQAQAPMWGRLRVALLGAVWGARCQLTLGTTKDSVGLRAHDAAAAVLARLTEGARLGHLRVTADVCTLSTAYPSQWFRGRTFSMEQAQFLREWAMEGRFCEVVDGPEPLWLKVTREYPVPLPGLDEHLAREAAQRQRRRHGQRRRHQQRHQRGGWPGAGPAFVALPAPPDGPLLGL